MSGFGLKSVTFKAGPRPGHGPLTIEIADVLVIVGPNNSGKSLALREIEEQCGEAGPASKRHLRVVESIDLRVPGSSSELQAILGEFRVSGDFVGSETEGGFRISTRNSKGVLQTQDVSQTFLEDAVGGHEQERLRVAWWLTTHIDARTRFELVGPEPINDLTTPPDNLFAKLARDDEARASIRKETASAFGLKVVLHDLTRGNYRLMVNPRDPTAGTDEELGSSKRTVEYHRFSRPLTEDGDGVQAFVGLLIGLLGLPHRIVIVDEPEAFLHPPQARGLATKFARTMGERGGTLVVATHSSDSLMGVIEAGVDVSIARLGFEKGIASARALAGSQVAKLARDPLLRSTDALGALFHRGAVVTEADADRAFYQEINRRLVEVGRGVTDAAFLNSQNRQTVGRLVRPLRVAGVPAVAVVDLDVLEGGGDWKGLLDACGVPYDVCDKVNKMRSNLESCVPLERGKSLAAALKGGGIDGLAPVAKNTALQLLADLAEYGLFVVPVGELEKWMHGLGIQGDKKKWITEMLDRAGTSPSDFTPGCGDIWEFVQGMKGWVDKADRLGMP